MSSVNASSVPIRFESVRSITKTVLSTSQTNTVDVGTTNQLTIGERVVYRIRIEKPQGISSPFTVTDLLPPERRGYYADKVALAKDDAWMPEP